MLAQQGQSGLSSCFKFNADWFPRHERTVKPLLAERMPKDGVVFGVLLCCGKKLELQLCSWRHNGEILIGVEVFTDFILRYLKQTAQLQSLS